MQNCTDIQQLSYQIGDVEKLDNMLCCDERKEALSYIAAESMSW